MVHPKKILVSNSSRAPNTTGSLHHTGQPPFYSAPVYMYTRPSFQRARLKVQQAGKMGGQICELSFFHTRGPTPTFSTSVEDILVPSPQKELLFSLCSRPSPGHWWEWLPACPAHWFPNRTPGLWLPQTVHGPSMAQGLICSHPHLHLHPLILGPWLSHWLCPEHVSEY